MAQYLVFFNNYTDVKNFDGYNNSCLFIGPITLISTNGKLFISPLGNHTEDVITELIPSAIQPFNFRAGNQHFKSFMIFSEDIPSMRRFILIAQNGSRLITYSEYGFLNHIKYHEGATIGILAPNSKKVESYLVQKCTKKAFGQINPAHPAVIIVKRFDSAKKSYIIMAHSISDNEVGQDVISSYDAWFNYITQEQKLFIDDLLSPLTDDAVFGMERIATGE